MSDVPSSGEELSSTGVAQAASDGFARRSLLRRLMDVVALPSSRGNMQDRAIGHRYAVRRRAVLNDVTEVGVIERAVVRENDLSHVRRIEREEAQQPLGRLAHLLKAAGAQFARADIGLEKDFEQQVAGNRPVLHVAARRRQRDHVHQPAKQRAARKAV